MSTENHDPHGESVSEPGKPEESTSGFAAADPLTVADILDTEQSEQAKNADSCCETAADPADPQTPVDAEPDNTAQASSADNPYLEDLRRLTAEYANYRKRTEDNAELEKQRAAARVITPLLSVLDDFERATAHGDLPAESPITAIVQKLQDTLARQGLEVFGEVGEVFDPAQHEAIAQVPHPSAEPNTIIDVIERGYRLGTVELRPAKVAVALDG